MLNTASETVENLRIKMDETASALPEYPVVMAMNGVGSTLGPQLMAEIGDVTRFTHREALTAFAGVDPGKNDSGKHVQKSVRTSKKGSPHLRRTLFQIMDGLIKRSPIDDPVYVFMDKKTCSGQALLRLHDCRRKQVSPYLLRTGTGILRITARNGRKLSPAFISLSDQRPAVVWFLYF